MKKTNKVKLGKTKLRLPVAPASKTFADRKKAANKKACRRKPVAGAG